MSRPRPSLQRNEILQARKIAAQNRARRAKNALTAAQLHLADQIIAAFHA